MAIASSAELATVWRSRIKELSPKFNRGRRVNIVSQRLGYLVRCGEPDAIDSIVPMAFGNLALDLILQGQPAVWLACETAVTTTCRLT